MNSPNNNQGNSEYFEGKKEFARNQNFPNKAPYGLQEWIMLKKTTRLRIRKTNHEMSPNNILKNQMRVQI